MDIHTNIFHVYASRLGASCLTNAHVLQICPALLSDLEADKNSFLLLRYFLLLSLIELQQ